MFFIALFINIISFFCFQNKQLSDGFSTDGSSRTLARSILFGRRAIDLKTAVSTVKHPLSTSKQNQYFPDITER